MHRLPCLLKIGCHEDPSKDVLFCAQNIWICGLRLWSISLNGEAQFCCLYPRPDGRGKDCRSTNKSTDSAPSSPQQITTLIYLLLKYTTYTFVLMDPKNVTFCVHELKLSCPDQGLTSWLPDWTNKLIAGVELSCTQTPGHRLSLRTSRCFFFRFENQTFRNTRTRWQTCRGWFSCLHLPWQTPPPESGAALVAVTSLELSHVWVRGCCGMKGCEVCLMSRRGSVRCRVICHLGVEFASTIPLLTLMHNVSSFVWQRQPLPISVQLFPPVLERQRPSPYFCRQVEVRLMFGVSFGGGEHINYLYVLPNRKVEGESCPQLLV